MLLFICVAFLLRGKSNTSFCFFYRKQFLLRGRHWQHVKLDYNGKMVGLTFIIHFTQPQQGCVDRVFDVQCSNLTGSSLFHSPRKGINPSSSTYRLNRRVECALLLWVAAPEHGGKLLIQSPGDNKRNRLFMLETATTYKFQNHPEEVWILSGSATAAICTFSYSCSICWWPNGVRDRDEYER